jgi:nitrogen fixation/metabolism regulation signal transduction histidine kinase
MTHELGTSRQRLLKAERLAAWQQVARQISHEIKNSITPIAIALRRLHAQLGDESLTPRTSESLRSIEDELHALESMAAEFSEFARMPEPKKSSIGLNDIVRSVARLIEPASGLVKIDTHLQPDLPVVEADAGQMKRVIHNLIKNAVEASHNTGTVIVSTREAQEPKHAVEIEIQDQGEGMDEETIEKMFQPYFTKKKKGTGLGLAIVQKIIDDHHGEIRVNSKKNRGTTITVSL